MTPKQITDALELSIGPSGSVRQLRDEIENVLLTKFSQPPTTAAELSEKLKSKIVVEITERAEAAIESGSFSTLDLRNNETAVHGTLHLFPGEDASVTSAKRNRQQAHRLLRAIKALDFSDFEKLGGAVLRELGCTTPRVTRHSSDQGIDFYGEVSIGEVLKQHAHLFYLMHATRTVIVGQAKHYPTRTIGPSVVRELVGALSLARTSSFSKPEIDLFDKMELKPFSPALAMLFTTGEFTRGACQLAKEAGILLYSGWQISVFLADCKVGMRSVGDALEFDEPSFHSWLELGVSS